MELSYWESRWKKANIGFHMPGGYPGLKKHWDSLNLPASPEVLVPLSGKTPDMVWMAARGARVTGSEISGKAVREFFEEQGLQFQPEKSGEFTVYRSENIELWQGDFMKLPVKKMPGFDLIYDKAALVALPPEKRPAYAQKLINLCCNKTSLLLHHFIYEQDEMTGPPFSVDPDEIRSYFSSDFDIITMEKNELNISDFEKFLRRGLKTQFTEQLLNIIPKSKK